ncbi:MAG: prepilin-type N-terminal cleavage/methylation domain-containing protein [Candidatus Saccharimonas sp.]
MTNRYNSKGHQINGFTIVELVVVIVVISILAAMSMVAYNGVQLKASEVALQANLKSARDAITLNSAFDVGTGASSGGGTNAGIELPDSFKNNPNTPMELVQASNVPHYDNLSPVQNGVLFADICNQLTAEGYGVGTNNGGQTETYITACNVYNSPQLQVNSAWSGHNFNVPVKSNTLSDLANSLNYNDSWRPNRTAVEQEFYNTWDSRFTASGGVYPVTSFWDPWANQWSGVPMEALPAPTVPDQTGYCIEAHSERYPDVYYHITDTDSTPVKGKC